MGAVAENVGGAVIGDLDGSEAARWLREVVAATDQCLEQSLASGQCHGVAKFVARRALRSRVVRIR